MRAALSVSDLMHRKLWLASAGWACALQEQHLFATRNSDPTYAVRNPTGPILVFVYYALWEFVLFVVFFVRAVSGKSSRDKGGI